MIRNFFCLVCCSYWSAAGRIQTVPCLLLKEDGALWKKLEKPSLRWPGIW